MARIVSVIQLSDYPRLGKPVLSTTLIVLRDLKLGIKLGVLRRPNGKASLVNALHGAMP